jgi:hypothetical protein
MNLTSEQRQLLEGDSERAARNLPLLGWSNASSAPDWAKARILEIRSAIVEKRSIPAPSRDYVVGAEKRSAALGFSQRLFGESLRAKADRLGALIFADHINAHAHEIILKDWAERAVRAGFALNVESPAPRTEDGGAVSCPQGDAIDNLRCKAVTASEHRASAERHRVLASRSTTSLRSAEKHYSAQDLHNALADAIDDNLADDDYNDRCAAACRASFIQESA